MPANHPVRPALALVVGIDEYELPRQRLRFCTRDATCMHQRLLELGWHDDCAQLKHDLSAEELLHATESFVSRVQGAVEFSVMEERDNHDLLIVIYFAGHAVEKDGALWLLPTNSNDGVNVQDMFVRPLNRMHLPDGRKLVAILCFDSSSKDLGNLSWLSVCEDERTPRLTLRGNRALKSNISATPNEFLFLWACDPGRVASANQTNVLFTDELLQRLGRNDSQSILELFTDVQSAVAERVLDRQCPQQYSTLTSRLVLSHSTLGAGILPLIANCALPPTNPFNMPGTQCLESIVLEGVAPEMMVCFHAMGVDQHEVDFPKHMPQRESTLILDEFSLHAGPVGTIQEHLAGSTQSHLHTDHPLASFTATGQIPVWRRAAENPVAATPVSAPVGPARRRPLRSLFQGIMKGVGNGREIGTIASCI